MAHPSSASKPSERTTGAYQHYVRASDVGSYLYCKRAWWLERVHGWQPDDVQPRRARGITAHRHHGCWMWLSTALVRLAWLCTIAVGAIAIAMWLGWWPW